MKTVILMPSSASGWIGDISNFLIVQISGPSSLCGAMSFDMTLRVSKTISGPNSAMASRMRSGISFPVQGSTLLRLIHFASLSEFGSMCAFSPHFGAVV